MKIELNIIQEFKHLGTINRFKKEYPEKALRAELVFKDLMTFFWGTQKHFEDKKQIPLNIDLDFVFIMDEQMKDIDLMWHLFLLYTRDYQVFCEENFGEFIHHQPDIAPGLPQSLEYYEQNLSRFLNYGVENFGEETIARWFNEEMAS